jgi:FKBP-type peptidyl-prolyl cis-trans isomerase SlpA
LLSHAGAPEKGVDLGDTILLHYKLSSPDGQVFENTFNDAPVTLTLGRGELAANLENCLIGLGINARHVFMLDPAQAFGCFDARLVQRIALTEFSPEMTLAPKAMIEFQLPNGTTLPGVIQTLDGSAAVVDFNHPLSDCPVHFEVEILQITPVAQLPPLDSR